MTESTERVQNALRTATDYLVVQRNAAGCWEGRLSSSALSTATAVSALQLGEADAGLVRDGIAWLERTQNADGGWGDTPASASNLSTTLLVLAAMTLADTEPPAAARAYLRAQAGGDTSAAIAAAVTRRYGDDRTFAVPILMNCALAGLVGWEDVPPLPYELAAVPSWAYTALNLQVVSYALPALIAVGMVIAQSHPPCRPFTRALRRAVIPRVRAKLAWLQPEHGGYLDAAPLTAFVAMSQLTSFGAGDPVAERCLDFLRNGRRADGSWPIDTDLAVWLTTSAVNALTQAEALAAVNAPALRVWIAARQDTTPHRCTGAAPGGWGWTNRAGSVPDVDDTSGALLALYALGEDTAIPAGLRWLSAMQNRDGGWPTFCRGWGRLPFDRSSPDVTAHAMRALLAGGVNDNGIARALRYLRETQRTDGAWLPLWFGNQSMPDGSNPVFGTARVLRALALIDPHGELARRGVAYLVGAQAADGGWGGAAGLPSTVEETALAVSALVDWRTEPAVAAALERSVAYLLRRIDEGTWIEPAPIGLYFASLWYAEVLYPVIWTIEALGRVVRAGVR